MSLLSEDADACTDSLREKELLWLYIPDWTKDGMMSEIKSIPHTVLEDTPYWTESKNCAGFEVPDDCELRVDEMTLVNFTPYICNGGSNY